MTEHCLVVEIYYCHVLWWCRHHSS